MLLAHGAGGQSGPGTAALGRIIPEAVYTWLGDGEIHGQEYVFMKIGLEESGAGAIHVSDNPLQLDLVGQMFEVAATSQPSGMVF